jgi:hypothetical protein
MRSLGGGDEIARSRLGRSIRKLTISCPAGWDLVLFFRNADKPASDYSWATRDRASALRLAARKWRRKPLKSLKTDSPIRRLGITGRKIDQANSLLWVRKAKVIVKNVGGGGDCPERYDDRRAPWAWWLLTKS